MKFYRCKHCGQIVAIVKETKVPIMCCGEAMEEIIPGTTDAAVEKRVFPCRVPFDVPGGIHAEGKGFPGGEEGRGGVQLAQGIGDALAKVRQHEVALPVRSKPCHGVGPV